MVSRREFLTIGTGGLAAASLATPRLGAGPRADAEARRHADPPDVGSAALRSHPRPRLQDARGDQLHAQPAPASTRRGRACGPARSRSRAISPSRGSRRTTRRTSSSSSKGVRFHAKPPVNGRELTAEDVRYTFERILTDKGSVNVSMYRSIAKVEAVDKYTVRFTLKEPFAWFLDMIANPMAGAIIAQGVRREVRRPQEAGGGDRHRPVDARQLQAERRRSRWCATRTYFVAGPAVHRPGRDDRRRGQRLAHRPRSSPASTTSAGSSRARSTARTGCRSPSTLKKRRPEPPDRWSTPPTW